jgi:hypothetical protein
MTGSDATITCRGPISLTGDITWDTRSGNGYISLQGALDGSGTLAPYSGKGAKGSMVMNAGTGDITFNRDIGGISPLLRLELTGNSILLNNLFVNTVANQVYHSPIEVDPPLIFRSIRGNITLESSLDPTEKDVSVFFTMGGGDVTLKGDVGISLPFRDVAIHNAGNISVQGVQAGTFRVSGGLPEMFLHGPLTLTGLGGLFLDGGPIHIGAPIETRYFFMRSRGSTSNIGEKHPITVTGLGPILFNYLNAIEGNIGTYKSPIEINQDKENLIGAHVRADLAGTVLKGSLDSIPSNPPCIVTLNGVTIQDCNTIPTHIDLYNAIPKYLFYLPGIYSSWDNLSNSIYFVQVPPSAYEDSRNRQIFWPINFENASMEAGEQGVEDALSLPTEDQEKDIPEPLAPEPLAPEPLAPEPMVPEPMTPEPRAPEPMIIEEIPESSEKYPQQEKVDWGFTLDLPEESLPLNMEKEQ